MAGVHLTADMGRMPDFQLWAKRLNSGPSVGAIREAVRFAQKAS
jgi:hypothetical protein